MSAAPAALALLAAGYLLGRWHAWQHRSPAVQVRDLTGRTDGEARDSGQPEPDHRQMTGTRRCGHDADHAPHSWATRPGVHCPGLPDTTQTQQ